MKIAVLMEYASENGLEIIRELQRLEINIKYIICIGHEYPPRRQVILEERTAGQYQRPRFSELLNQHPTPIYFVDDVNSENCYNLIKELAPDLLVSEGTRIIRRPVFELPKLGMLNVHQAILPYFRGCSCLEWAILNDFPIGATGHYLIKAVDAGPIIERVKLHYNGKDTYECLRTKAIFLAALVMGSAVSRIVYEGFRFEKGLVVEKGPWYSPMRDTALVTRVKKKLRNSQYCPKPVPDRLPLKTVDVELPQGRIIEVP